MKKTILLPTVGFLFVLCIFSCDRNDDSFYYDGEDVVLSKIDPSSVGPGDPWWPGLPKDTLIPFPDFEYHYGGQVVMSLSDDIMGTYDTGDTRIDDSLIDDITEMGVLGVMVNFSNGVVIFRKPIFGGARIPTGDMTYKLIDKEPTYQGNVEVYNRYFITIRFSPAD